MEMQASVRDNVEVISNDLVYSEDDVVTGFTEPLITSSNKGNLHKQFAALSDKIQVSGRKMLLFFVCLFCCLFVFFFVFVFLVFYLSYMMYWVS